MSFDDRHGINRVTISGNVGNVYYGQTTVKNEPVVAFMICIEDKDYYTTWTRVSAYGRHAEHLKNVNLEKGDYVIVDGVLFNKASRSHGHNETEVKITNKIIVNKKHKGGYRGGKKEADG